MIIDKVHHPLRFLTISLSYGRSRLPFFACSSPGCMEGVSGGGGLSAQTRKAFPAAISEASLRACRFSCLGQELRGQDSHSGTIRGKVLIYEHLAATSSCILPLAGQGETENMTRKALKTVPPIKLDA